MGPSLTDAERAMLTEALSGVAAAQASIGGGPRFAQARSGQDDEWASLGVSAEAMATARAAGVTAQVHEYEGPKGRGWELELRLVRDGVTWRKVLHSGPETWRERDWEAVSPLGNGG